MLDVFLYNTCMFWLFELNNSNAITSPAVILLGQQDLPDPAVPAEEGRAALTPSGPNGPGGWRTDKDAGARRESRCFQQNCSVLMDIAYMKWDFMMWLEDYS